MSANESQAMVPPRQHPLPTNHAIAELLRSLYRPPADVVIEIRDRSVSVTLNNGGSCFLQDLAIDARFEDELMNQILGALRSVPALARRPWKPQGL